MTRQIKDTLIYKEERLVIDQYLLEDYFDEFPDQRPSSDVRCSALWRKYRVTSEIINGEFIVRSIKVLSPTKTMVFEDWEGSFPLNKKFDGFSGLIRIDENRLADWKEEGEHFEYLEVYRGDVKRVLSFSNKDLQLFREEQFVHFQKTRAYEAAYEELEKTTTPWAVHKIPDLIKDVFLHRYSRILVENTYGV